MHTPTINQYLTAGPIGELRLHIVPLTWAPAPGYSTVSRP